MRALARWLRQGDRWIPALFVLGFAIVIAVNGAMVWIAIATSDRVETNSYKQGLEYTTVLEGKRRQAKLGWHAAIVLDAPTRENGRLRVELVDLTGDHVQGADAVALFVRPVHVGDDFEVPLTERAPGVYMAEVALPKSSLWEVRFGAARGRDSFAEAMHIVVR